MADPKKNEKPKPGIRQPQGQAAKGKFGLRVRSWHEEHIKPVAELEAPVILPGAKTAGVTATVAEVPPASAAPVAETVPPRTPAVAPLDSPAPIAAPANLTPAEITPARGSWTVPFKGGELRIPNSYVWHVFRTLPADERGVFEELYLWTAGFGLSTRRLSKAQLCKTLQCSETSLNRILNALVKRGLLTIGGSVSTGPMVDRGTDFTIHLPEISTAAEPAPVKMTPARKTGGRPALIRATPADSGVMKREEENTRRETRDLRTMALRIRQRRISAHPDGYGVEQWANDLRDALDDVGIEATEEEIRAAIGI